MLRCCGQRARPKARRSSRHVCPCYDGRLRALQRHTPQHGLRLLLQLLLLIVDGGGGCLRAIECVVGVGIHLERVEDLLPRLQSLRANVIGSGRRGDARGGAHRASPGRQPYADSPAAVGDPRLRHRLTPATGLIGILTGRATQLGRTALQLRLRERRTIGSPKRRRVRDEAE